MGNQRWLWVTAVVITLASAVYQRMSGPTYPVRGSVTLGGEAIALRLTRTHPGAGDQPVVLKVPDAAVTGHVAWRRYPTGGGGCRYRFRYPIPLLSPAQSCFQSSKETP